MWSRLRSMMRNALDAVRRSATETAPISAKTMRTYECPVDKYHCECWYENMPCCSCGEVGMKVRLKEVR